MLSGIVNHLNPLAGIPAKCNSLTVDEHFAPFVGDHTEQPAILQHLAIRYMADRQTFGKDFLEALSSLSHLTQLRSLKVEVPGAVSGLAGLGNLPESLIDLSVGGWGMADLIIVLPELKWSQAAKCLGRLNTLQFHRCNVHASVGSIANLKDLTSLSLCHCGFGRALDAVTKLTNLVYLDLTGVMTRGVFPGGRQPWSRFEAWPALCVLKFVGCCLIDNSTVLDIASVHEVHTDRLSVGMKTARVHLVLRNRHAAVFETLASLSTSRWSTQLVDLHVAVVNWSDGARYLTTTVKQVLGALVGLESFHLVGGYDGLFGQAVDYDQGQIVLGDDYSGRLKDLKLQDLRYHTLDLGVATCLTSIRLKNIDKPGVSCELILPSRVARLEVFGDSLTIRHAKRVLEGLPSLTHLTLGTSKFDFMNELMFSSSACMPTMPGSLRWLHVTSKAMKNLLDGSAQDYMRFCTGLEHLILPLGQNPQGNLMHGLRVHDMCVLQTATLKSFHGGMMHIEHIFHTLFEH